MSAISLTEHEDTVRSFYPDAVCLARPIYEHDMYGEHSVWPGLSEDGLRGVGRALGAGPGRFSAWKDAAERCLTLLSDRNG